MAYPWLTLYFQTLRAQNSVPHCSHTNKRVRGPPEVMRRLCGVPARQSVGAWREPMWNMLWRVRGGSASPSPCLPGTSPPRLPALACQAQHLAVGAGSLPRTLTHSLRTHRLTPGAPARAQKAELRPRACAHPTRTRVRPTRTRCLLVAHASPARGPPWLRARCR